MVSIPNSADTAQPVTKDWESEGGALERPPVPIDLPEGIIAVPSIYYRFGRYSYLRLEDAVAEHERQSKKAN